MVEKSVNQVKNEETAYIKQYVNRGICLDPRKPLAREYNDRDIFEKTVQIDFSPSIYDMVKTGVAGISNVNSGRYTFPPTPDDDNEAHEMPDYQRLRDIDIAEKEQVIDEFLNDENNYVKPEPSTETSAVSGSTETTQAAP